MSINDAFAARRAANFVDPMLGYVDAKRRLFEQIPVTVAKLQEFDLPSHKLAHRTMFDGQELIAWRYVYADPAAIGQRTKQVAPATRRALAFYLDETTQPYEGKFLHTLNVDAQMPFYEVADLDKLSTLVINGMIGLLERIAKPARRAPWDA